MGLGIPDSAYVSFTRVASLLVLFPIRKKWETLLYGSAGRLAVRGAFGREACIAESSVCRARICAGSVVVGSCWPYLRGSSCEIGLGRNITASDLEDIARTVHYYDSDCRDYSVCGLSHICTD